MRRVFLDANVLVSAAWTKANRIRVLWDRPDICLVTSGYALLEAERNINIKNPAAAERLADLAGRIDISYADARLTSQSGPPEKDQPILQAAVGARCEVLITGDKTHFGHLFGSEVEGVRILTVSELMKELES